MSGFYNYWPKVNHPDTVYHQMESGGFQAPFFFGGSQVPVNLSGSGFKKSKTHKGDFDFTTKKGDKVFHQEGHYVRANKMPFM